MLIGIYGFGTFGQFIAKTFVAAGHRVVGHSRSDYTPAAERLGASFERSLEAFCAQPLDVLVLSVSILSFERCLAALPLASLPAGVCIVDVLSVKTHPKRLLAAAAPAGAEVLCTHPMFGPESGKHGWQGLPFVFEYVRRGPKGEAFVALFRDQGCAMVEMSCEEHDQHAASSQFITHTTGRVLAELDPKPTPISTKGFEVLLELVGNTCKDSFDLYYGLYKYNPNAVHELVLLESSLRQLHERLASFDPATEAGSHRADSRQLNPRVAAMRASTTVAVASRAADLLRQGRDIVSLSVGEPDSAPHAAIEDAAVACIRRHDTKYTELPGLHALRTAIAAKLERENAIAATPDQITCTSGAKQAVTQAIIALTRPGDEVIVPVPYWVSYPEMVTLAGGRTVLVDTAPAHILTPELLEPHLNARTRILVLCTPSNPTGAVYSRAQLDALAALLRRFPHVWILADEIYEHLIFGGAAHTSFASLPGFADRTVTVNGFSKGFCMTGYRLGYAVAPTDITRAIRKIQSQMTTSASTIAQHAAMAALALGAEATNGLAAEFEKRRDYCLGRIRDGLGDTVQCNTPQGAFYLFVDVSSVYDGSREPLVVGSVSLALFLLEQHGVAVVPGSAFGDDRCVRLAYTVGMDDLAKAMDRFVAGVLACKSS